MYEAFDLDIEASGNGDAQNVTNLTDKWVFFRGLSAGTCNLQTSVDGTNFYTHTAQTADGWVEVPEPATHIRLNGSGLTLTAATLRALNPSRL